MSNTQSILRDCEWFAKTMHPLLRLSTVLWVFDIDNARVLWSNSAGLALWQADSLDELISRNMGDTMSSSVNKRLLQYQSDFVKDENTEFKENWTIYPNDEPATVEVVYRGILTESGRMCMLCEAKTDNIFEAEALRSSEALLHTPVQIRLYCEAGTSLYQNPAARSASCSANESIHEHFSNKDLVNTLTAKSSDDVNTVSRVNTRHGDRWHDITARRCTDAVTGKSAWLVSEVDVTQLKMMEEHAQFLAGHDTLTKLPNRKSFSPVFQQRIDNLISEGKTGCLLFIDLDRFKDINDTLGHAAGDKLLVEVADRLTAIATENNSVARLGGDEFLLLIGPCLNATEISARIDEISRSVSRSMVIEGRELQVTPSIGAALFPADGSDIDVLMQHADLAMYHAKDSGRNSYSFFSTEMSEAVSARISLDTEIATAIDNNEFVTYFQPRVCTTTNKIVCAEALVRWQHPEKGMIPPNEFIPACEASGAITEIGKIVLAQTVLAQRSLAALGFDIRMSVNLSPVQFADADMVDEISRIVKQYEGDPQNIEFEITESVLLGNDSLTINKLNALVECGFKVSIDDFGTGYSNLAYLHKYPLNCIKIDRSFIQEIDKAQPIVQLIISMANVFGMSVVAEGVETEEQLGLLKEYQCDEYQGFLFSRPLPLDDFKTLFESYNQQVA